MDSMQEQPEGRRPEWRPPTKEKLKKSFSRFAIALNDVQFARIMWRRAAEAFEQKDLFAVAGFQAAFFASYGRLFTPTSKGANTISAKSPYVSPEHFPLHEQLLEARHAYVAHSDRELRRVRVYPPGATRDGEAVSQVDSGMWTWATRYLEFGFGPELEDHLGTLERVLKEKAEEVFSQLTKCIGIVVVAETPLEHL
jgi:hypothetical protein